MSTNITFASDGETDGEQSHELKRISTDLVEPFDPDDALTEKILRDARRHVMDGDMVVDDPDLPLSPWLVRSVLWHAQTGQGDVRVAVKRHEIEVSESIPLEDGDGECLVTAWIQCDTETGEVHDVVATTEA